MSTPIRSNDQTTREALIAAGILRPRTEQGDQPVTPLKRRPHVSVPIDHRGRESAAEQTARWHRNGQPLGNNGTILRKARRSHDSSK